MADAQPIHAAASQELAVRKLLHELSRLVELRAEGRAALDNLRDKRQSDISAAEQTARERTRQRLDRAMQLSDRQALSGTLRAALLRYPRVDVRHFEPGPPPTTFESALDEWQRLAPSAVERVRAFESAHAAWRKKLVKFSGSHPSVDDSLWKDLDRLDLIHATIPSLTQAVVAAEIRAAGDASDVVYQAESESQRASERHVAAELRSALAQVESLTGAAGAPWSDPRWTNLATSGMAESLVRLGVLAADLTDHLGTDSVPALIPFPLASGISIEAGVDERTRAVALIRSLLLRLFAAVPPGCLHAKVIDPVAIGQSVAEFRHLAEYHDSLVDEKTWTSERDIEQVLDRLADHLEIVISRYLRGQFDTIDDYNRHAGEVAEPYRVLVIFDYPAGFSDSASRRLLSLIENGPRCGIFVVLHSDTSRSPTTLPSELTADRLVRDMHRVTLGASGDSLTLPEPVGRIDLPFLPDAAPDIVFGTDGRPSSDAARLLANVGTAVRQKLERPPAVTLDSLLPVLNRLRTGPTPEVEKDDHTWSRDPSTWWAATTASRAVAPIGRSGAQDVASMHFSSTEVAGGAIMVGLPRSGKTTSLHALITTMSMLYSPAELEFYLIDAKHGVEFKAYENLPHARMVSVHSEREYSVALLKAIDAEIRRRAEVMKTSGAHSNITEYRRESGDDMARVVVVIDEFHELFEEPDQLGNEAFAAFSNIVRMGPFSGVHLVVASQTLSSMPAMDRPTLTLLPQRVAFMCNEYDAEIVLGDTNRAAANLSKTGEGVFNPLRGEETKNQLFQGLLIEPQERTRVLEDVRAKAASIGWTRQPRVFDGDAAVSRPRSVTADRRRNRISVPIGEPFTLAESEEVLLRRSRGANVLLAAGTGDDGVDTTIRGALQSFVLAGAEQATVTVLDLLGDDDEDGLTTHDLARSVGARYARSTGSTDVLDAAFSAVDTRVANGQYDADGMLTVIIGLERALFLQPVDPYAYDEESSLAKKLLGVLQSGPEVGVHTVIAADSSGAVERRLGGEALQELTLRIVGSAGSQQDVAAAFGGYGAVAPLRPGQLLVGDQVRGTSRRVRGYEAVRDLGSLQA